MKRINIKYLTILTLLFTACSDNDKPEIDHRYQNEHLVKLCSCLSNKRNLDMQVSLDTTDSNKSICMVLHKTQREWEAKFTLEKLVGLSHYGYLENMKLAPQFDKCMEEALGGRGGFQAPAEVLANFEKRCYRHVYKKEYSSNECSGF